ncbi:unnamed protein product [Symbiodinium sp. CCMP2456]|nr:unnamed protein product [Symbiodinium sp. CCMP2456]
MSAQLSGSDSAARVSNRGQGDGVMVNGTTEPRGSDPSGESVLASLENPNLLDTVQLGDRPGPLQPLTTASSQPHSAEPQYATPDPGARVITTVERNFSTEQTASQQPTTPTSSSVRVQEFFATQTSQSPPGDTQGVRWMARFSEFLRTTASRGAMGVDRMLDGLGIPPLPVQQRVARVASTNALRLNVSPPEDLTSPPTQAPAIPGSWSVATPPQAPLFGPLEMAQMRQAQMNYPQIYGPLQGPSLPSEDSERSSRLLAEVQRQLEEYENKYKSEVERLELEVVRMREERDQALRTMARYLRVQMYQKGIMAYYLRVLVYQKGIMACYLRVHVYQEGIMAHYLQGSLSSETMEYLSRRLCQKGC